MNTCSKCGKNWTSMVFAHCGACHKTFSNVGLFDIHRISDGGNGECKDPREIKKDGVFLHYDKTKQCWRGPKAPEGLFDNRK